MNLKNIINLFLLFILSFTLISCSKINLKKQENSDIELVEKETIETLDIIEESSFDQKSALLDFYNRNNSFYWDKSVKLKKIYVMSFGKRSDVFLSSPSNLIISNNFIYYVDSQTKFIKFDLNERKKVFEIQLEDNTDSNLILPTSLAKNQDYFYVGFGNGTVIKIDSEGKKYWKKEFNDLIRTPLRIVNDNIVLLFNSNKIISLNPHNGSVIWEINYQLNKPSLSTGGQIIVKQNLIFFVMSNGRIGVIDTIVGESVEYSFLTDFIQKNIMNYNYEAKLHIYNQLLSLIEGNNTIYTYDLNNKEFLLFDETISSFKSIYFLNNSFLALKNNNLLISYNLKNIDLFWKVNLSKILSKKDTIIESYVINNTVLVFFSTGKIIQLNKLNGEILFKQDLNLADINLVTARDNYFIFNQSNGKAFFYKQ